MPPADSPRLPLVIVNGLGAPRIAGTAYGKGFRKDGYAHISSAPQRLLGYGDLRIATRLLDEHITGVLDRTGAAKVDLIGMSLGGLIGLYYMKCVGGARRVRRFVSVGGPLKGSTLARLTALVPLPIVHAIAQTSPDSHVMRELAAAPPIEGVSLYSIGTRGDVLTPRSSWEIPDATNIETPFGFPPFGHWMLFLDPRNRRVVAEILARPG